MLIPVELELLAEGADVVMSLELSSLRYLFIQLQANIVMLLSSVPL